MNAEPIKRRINIYQLDDHQLIQEIIIDDIDFDLLYKIIRPPFIDPLLYDDYALTIGQVTAINEIIINKVDIKEDIYHYKLVCLELYIWLI
jgi:hypothetical protein